MNKNKLITIPFIVCLLFFLISVVGYFSLKFSDSSHIADTFPFSAISEPDGADGGEDSYHEGLELKQEQEEASGEEASEPLTVTEEDITSKSRKGQIAFNTPEKMYVGDTKIIETKITDDLKTILNITVEEEEAIERDKIDIYNSMKAKLSGTGFDITALQENSPYLVLPDKVVVWRWAITPKKRGKQKLYLTINAKLKLGDSEITYTLQSFERMIEVEVNIGNWFQKNWLKIVEIFLVIFGGGIVAYIASKLTVMKNLAEKLNSWIKSSLSRFKK